MSHVTSNLKPANLGSSGQVDPLTNVDDLDAKVEAMLKQADEVHQRVTKRQDGIIDETAAAIEQQTKAAAALTEQARLAGKLQNQASASTSPAMDDELLGPMDAEFGSGAGVTHAPSPSPAAEPAGKPAAAAGDVAGVLPRSAQPEALSAKESLQRAIEEAMRLAPSTEEIARRLSEQSAISQAAEASAASTETLAADKQVPLEYATDAQQGHDASAPVAASEDEFADVQDVYAQAEASGQVSMIEPPLAGNLQAAKPEGAARQAAGDDGAQVEAVHDEAAAAGEFAEPEVAEASKANVESQPHEQAPDAADIEALTTEPRMDEASAAAAEQAADAAIEPEASTATATDEDPLDAQLASAIAAAEELQAAAVAQEPKVAAEPVAAAPMPVVAPAPVPVPAPASASSASQSLAAASDATTVQALDEQLAKALAAAGDDEFADGGVLVEDQSLDDIQPTTPVQASSPVAMPAPAVPAPAPAAIAAPAPSPAVVAAAAPVKPAASVSYGASASASMAPAPPVTKTASPAPKVAAAAAIAPAAPAVPAGPTLADRFWTVATPIVEPIAMRLGKLPASLQQTAGWVGLTTLFVAGCTWIYVLGFQETRPASQILEAQRAAAAASGEHGKGKPADGHGQDTSHDESDAKSSSKH